MKLEYKSDVFSLLLKEPENALDVYNALNGTSYDDPADVEIFSLENGIRLSVRNDASFIIDSYLNLYEHQSTFNPNMPLRGLIYISNLYNEIVKDHNLYGSHLIPIPAVSYVVFYNGTKDQPDVQTMKLSDAFITKPPTPSLELKCTMYNINRGRNEPLLSSSRILGGYSTFVDKVRKHNQKSNSLEEALSIAIDECIDERILADFFKAHRVEVMKTAMLDYTFERQIELEKRDSYSDGVAKGRAAGIAEGKAAGIAEATAAFSKKEAAFTQKEAEYNQEINRLKAQLAALQDK